MATIINAKTSAGGLAITPDTSGVIEFQSAGTTKAGVNATGLTGDGSQLTGLPAGGKIAQVLSATKTDTFSTTSATYVDVTGLSVAITPAATSSKIYVMVTISGSGQSGFKYRIVRGTTGISVGTGSMSNRIPTTGGGSNRNYNELSNPSSNFLDSPSTSSAVTYKVQVYANDNDGVTTANINKTGNDTDNNVTPRTTSTITVMEVAA